MNRWMLDTNAVSYFVRGTLRNIPAEADHLDGFCISVVSEAELIFGIKRRPEAHRLNGMILGFVGGVNVIPFDRAVAESYGALRAEMQRIGKALTALDMLIAAHALSIGATLVTSDTAFGHVPGLAVEDWR
ncbi:PIN domain-containing protein [Rhizobium sp.]